MTQPPPTPLARAAAGALGLAPDAGPDAGRAAFLSRLADDDFVPPAAVREAAAALGAVPNSPGPRPALEAAAESALAAEVERFGADYWSVSPADRRARWDELTARATPFPRLAGRLAGLEVGLDVVPPAPSDEKEAALAAAVVELYPLKPAARATRRPYLLREVGSAADQRTAARSLRDSHPEFRDLDHGLLEGLTMRRPPAEPIRLAPVRRRRDDEPEPAATGSDGRNWLWILIPICVAFCSGVTRQAGRHDSSVPSSPPKIYLSPPSGPNYNSGVTADRANQELAKILMERKAVAAGLNEDQRELLRNLAAGQTPTEAEALAHAREFLRLRDQKLAAPAATRPGPGTTSLFTAEQHLLVYQLGRPGQSEEAIARLLVQFVRAGKRGPTPAPPAGDGRARP